MKGLLVEQKITKKLTVAAGASEVWEVEIPASKTVFLKGVGYDYQATTTYEVLTGNGDFPKRTDQEGSYMQPMIYSIPFPCRSGGKLKLRVSNDGAASHDYNLVFLLHTNDILKIESDGGEMIQAIGAGVGVNTDVAIFNAAHTASAPVDATKGVSVDVIPNATLLCGTAITTAASKLVMAASTACKKVTVVADRDNAEHGFVGNTTFQLIRLDPGQSIDIEVSNLNQIYILRSGTSQFRVNYIGA